MRFPFAFVVNLLLLILTPLRWLRRRTAAPRGAFLDLRIDGALVEVARALPFWQRGRQPVALHALRKLALIHISEPTRPY